MSDTILSPCSVCGESLYQNVCRCARERADEILKSKDQQQAQTISTIKDIIRYEHHWPGKTIGSHISDILETIDEVYRRN